MDDKPTNISIKHQRDKTAYSYAYNVEDISSNLPEHARVRRLQKLNRERDKRWMENPGKRCCVKIARLTVFNDLGQEL